MTRKYLFTLFALATMVQAAWAQGFYYDIWIDGHRDAMRHGIFTPGENELTLDLSAIPSAGLHFLSVIPYCEEGEIGQWCCIPFYMPEGWPNSTDATAMEYWVSGYDRKPKRMAFTSSDVMLDIDVSQCSSGLHFFNFRTFNVAGEGGPWKVIPFYMPEGWPHTTDAKWVEYWVAGYDRKPKRMEYTGTEIPLDIDLSGMSYGLHYLNFRAFNEAGEAGAWKQIMFYISNFLFDPEEMSYEYWIDDQEPMTGTGYFPGELPLEFDVSDLPAGKHTFNFKAKNRFETYGELFSVQFDKEAITGIQQTEAHPQRLSIRAANGVLIIDSSTARELSIYQLDGKLVRRVHLTEGQNVVNGLPAGFYVVCGMKFSIR